MLFFANRSSRHAARLGPALTAHPVGVPAARVTPPHWLCRNRRQGEQTVRTGNPFKLALCLALAIPFALGACGGGGGGAPNTQAGNPGGSGPSMPGGSNPPETGGMDNGTPTPTPVSTAPQAERLKDIIAGALAIGGSGYTPSGALGIVEGGGLSTGSNAVVLQRPTSTPSGLSEEHLKYPSHTHDYSPTYSYYEGKPLREEYHPQAWVQYLTRTAPSVVGYHTSHPPGYYDFDANQKFESVEKNFRSDYNYERLDPIWPGIDIDTEHTAFCSHHDGTTGGASPLACGNGDLTTASLPAGRTARISDHSSTISYLKYSAFLLNKTYSLGNPSEFPDDMFIPDLEQWASSTGQLPPLTVAPPTGTWKGGMMGVLRHLKDNRSYIDICDRASGCTVAQAIAAEPRVVTGDVSLTLSTATPNRTGHGMDYPFSIEFSNIEDGDGPKPGYGWTWEGAQHFIEGSGRGTGQDFHMRAFHITHDYLDYEANSRERLEDYHILFYGPQFEEAGGAFVHLHNDSEAIIGAFGAKKQ